ncbi:MAG: hypothetical protein RR034_07015 [Bacteroidales bacterium]
MKNFFKKNVTIYHIIGVVLGLACSIIYWYKAGQFSDNILKSSPILMPIWGILVGYITFDLIRSSIHKKDN